MARKRPHDFVMERSTSFENARMPYHSSVSAEAGCGFTCMLATLPSRT